MLDAGLSEQDNLTRLKRDVLIALRPDEAVSRRVGRSNVICSTGMAIGHCPGRIDYKLFMGDATDSQRVELHRRFLPEATESETREFAQAHCTETMAEFQGLLLALEQDWTTLKSVEARSQLR